MLITEKATYFRAEERRIYTENARISLNKRHTCKKNPDFDKDDCLFGKEVALITI